ncbi:MAG: tyrosine--tRNA ligase, partial [Campylobacterales bacterium]
EFERIHAKGELPLTMPEVVIDVSMPLANLLVTAGLAASTSEARRAVAAGSVRINKQKCDDHSLVLTPGTYVIQIGKRKFAQVIVKG